MYVDPFVADRIKELDVQPGEVFQICKCQAKKGNPRTIYWLVRRDGELEIQMERDLQRSLDRVNAGDPAQPASFDPSSLLAFTSEPPLNAFHELHAPVRLNGKADGNNPSNGSGKVAPSSPPE